MNTLPMLGAMAAMLAGCAAVPGPGPVVPLPGGSPSCPIVGSSDWAAFVNAMPGPNNNPTLIVTGKVTVPSADYRAELTNVHIAESNPVQAHVELRVWSEGAGAQVPVTRDVRGQWPSPAQVGSVTVTCGGRHIATISPVETAH